MASSVFGPVFSRGYSTVFKSVFVSLSGTTSFTPNQIPNMVMWLDASDSTTIQQTNGFVSQWSDKSGQNNHAVQATGARQPSVSNSAVNGLTALSFDGTGTSMGSTSITSAISNSDVTVFTVARANSTITDNRSLFVGFSASLQRMYTKFTATGVATRVGNATDSVITASTSTVPHTIALRRTGAIQVAYLDGAMSASSSSAAGVVYDSVRIGAATLGGENFNGNICEILVYNRSLSDAEVLNVNNYLKAKWGIFNPMEVPNLLLWLDSADTSTISQTGGFVSQINDKSGNGYNATQPTGAFQPATGTRSVKGNNVLDFDGVDDFLSHSTSYRSMMSGTAEYTIFEVYATDNTATTQGIYTMQTGGSQTLSLRQNATSVSNLTGMFLNSPSDVSPHVVSYTRQGVNRTLRKDSLSVSDTNGADITFNNTVVSGRTLAGQNFLDGTIAEQLIYSRALTLDETNKVTNYLKVKWGTFSPYELSGLVGWYDAADTASITQTGGLVSQWNDKSGNGNNAVQGNASVQPQTGIATINGRNVITASNVNGTRLDLPFALRPTISSANISIFGVYRPSTTVSQGRLFSGSNGASPSGSVTVTSTGTLVSSFSGNATTGAPAVRNVARGFSAVANGSTQVVSQSDTTSGTGIVAPPLTQNTGPYLFREFNNLNAYDGDMAELLIFNRPLTVAEQNQVRAYLSSKWGITWANL